MYCRNCGKEVRQNATFCLSCKILFLLVILSCEIFGIYCFLKELESPRQHISGSLALCILILLFITVSFVICRKTGEFWTSLFKSFIYIFVSLIIMGFFITIGPLNIVLLPITIWYLFVSVSAESDMNREETCPACRRILAGEIIHEKNMHHFYRCKYCHHEWGGIPCPSCKEWRTAEIIKVEKEEYVTHTEGGWEEEEIGGDSHDILRTYIPGSTHKHTVYHTSYKCIKCGFEWKD